MVKPLVMDSLMCHITLGWSKLDVCCQFKNALQYWQEVETTQHEQKKC